MFASLTPAIVAGAFLLNASSPSARQFRHKRDDHQRRQLHQHRSAKIRDYQEGDAPKIYELLVDTSGDLFDPEGPLDVDCYSDASIQESYYQDKGDGCFLVVLENDEIVGCGGLIIGTSIQYLKSGASVSSNTVTGALRRVCCTQQSDLALLLAELEQRATVLAPTNELIALGYPSTRKNRPSGTLLQSLGYEALPEQIDGMGATQYQKILTRSSQKQPNPKTQTSRKRMTAMFGAALGVVALILVLGSFLSVADFLGLDYYNNQDNRGFGSPLSSEELQRLQQDERLQRTTLEAGEWHDLTSEQRQEESALMKVIQGKDVRLK